MSPPEVSLGIHELPADTHNGDTISIKDQDFIVSSLTMRWRLEGGKYKRYHHRLDVVGVFRLCSVHNISGRKARLVQPAETDLCLQWISATQAPVLGWFPAPSRSVCLQSGHPAICTKTCLTHLLQESMSRSLLNRYLDDLIQKPAAAPKKHDF